MSPEATKRIKKITENKIETKNRYIILLYCLFSQQIKIGAGYIWCPMTVLLLYF